MPGYHVVTLQLEAAPLIRLGDQPQRRRLGRRGSVLDPLIRIAGMSGARFAPNRREMPLAVYRN